MCCILERVFLLSAAHTVDQRFPKEEGRGAETVKQIGACWYSKNNWKLVIVLGQHLERRQKIHVGS